MMEKKFIIPPEDIQPLAMGYGECIIPDTVLVSGMPITHIFRVAPENRLDSGWRFYSGIETPGYMKDRQGVYDVNIAANYCPEIIQFLDSLPYTAFEKAADGRWYDVTLSTDWTGLLRGVD